jgi:hypothetical protein
MSSQMNANKGLDLSAANETKEVKMEILNSSVGFANQLDARIAADNGNDEVPGLVSDNDDEDEPSSEDGSDSDDSSSELDSSSDDDDSSDEKGEEVKIPAGMCMVQSSPHVNIYTLEDGVTPRNNAITMSLLPDDVKEYKLLFIAGDSNGDIYGKMRPGMTIISALNARGKPRHARPCSYVGRLVAKTDSSALGRHLWLDNPAGKWRYCYFMTACNKVKLTKAEINEAFGWNGYPIRKAHFTRLVAPILTRGI